jgi:WD40 repeat protein
VCGSPQPARSAAQFVATLARAVHVAHEHGIIHRDIKPANVLLQAGGQSPAEFDLQDASPKITDFGIAKCLDGEAPDQTATGEIVGTPGYMAPEQAASPRLTAGPAADIYSLGAVLYELLTGRPPFVSETPIDVVLQVIHTEPISVTRLRPSVPRDLETICLKCLRKEPRKRYATAADLADDLERFMNYQTIQARPVGMSERCWKWAKRKPALASLFTVLAAVFTIGLPTITVLWLQADQSSRNERNAHAAEAAQRRAAESALYLSQIALTRQYLEANQFTQAVEQHAACKAEMRNWEWYYLDRLCHTNLVYSVPKPVPEDQRDFYVDAVAFSPDGRQLLSASGLPYALTNHPFDAPQKTPGKIALWNVETGKLEETLSGHGGATWTAAFGRDGQVAWGSADGSVWLRHRPGAPPRLILEEKDNQVHGVLFSPDGKWLAIDRERDVLFWDMAASDVRSKLSFKGQNWGNCMAFDPQDRLLVCTRSPELELRLWDPASGQDVPLSFPAHSCSAMAFSRDGSLLALAPQTEQVLSDSTIISVVDVSNGRIYAELRGHKQPVTALAFGTDGSLPPGPPGLNRRATGRLYSGSDDRTVRAWDLRTGREAQTFHGHTLGITSLAVQPGGRRLASGGKDGVSKVWDLEPDPPAVSFQPLAQVLGEFLGDLRFTPDNHLQVLAMNGAVKGVRTWDAATGRWLKDHVLPVDSKATRPYRAVSFDRDARRVAAVLNNDSRAVKVWDTGSGTECATVAGLTQPVSAVALSPDGRFLATAGMIDRQDESRHGPAELVLWDVDGSGRLRRLPIEAEFVASLAFSPDGQRLAAAVLRRSRNAQPDNDPAEIEIWDLAKDQIVACLTGGIGLIPSLAFDPVGSKLAAAYYHESAVRVFDAFKGERRFQHDLGTPVTSVAFSPHDGSRLAAVGYDGLVHLWETDSGRDVLILRGLGPPGSGHYNFTAHVVFSPDGRRLAANDWDGTVTVWDAGDSFPAP